MATRLTFEFPSPEHVRDFCDALDADRIDAYASASYRVVDVAIPTGIWTDKIAGEVRALAKHYKGIGGSHPEEETIEAIRRWYVRAQR